MVSGYTEKKPRGYIDELDVWYVKKKEIKDDSNFFSRAIGIMELPLSEMGNPAEDTFGSKSYALGICLLDIPVNVE